MHRPFVSQLVLSLVALVLLSAVVVPAAHADTYTVGTMSDASAGPCPSATATDCSLRQLILYVEAHPSSPDTINVPSGTYTLNASFGQLLVNASMSIVGGGARTTTIQEAVPANRSQSGDRVFDVQVPSGGSAPTVALEAMAISGGDANANNPNGAYFGGDILNSGVLTLSDDWVTNGFACSGGGVSNVGGTLTIERSLVSANQAACDGGGDDSGGVQNYGEPACASCSPATADLPGRLVIDDSTVADNAARLGGGIFSWNDPSNTVTITNSTVADNAEQAEGGEPVRSDAGGLAIATGSAQVENTILADNTSTGATSGAAAASNCSAGAAVTSLGHNLEDADTCQFSGQGDLSNTNPELGELQDNGGPTDTLALVAGSPALDQVPAASCSATDQRGVPRPAATNCDIGAFELPTTSTSPTTTTTTTSPSPSPTVPVSFTVASSTPGGVALDASTPSTASRFEWLTHGRFFVCPATEPQLELSSSAPVDEPVTVKAIDASNTVLSTATNTVSIPARLGVKRAHAASTTPAMAGLCNGPITIPVPPLTPKKPAKAPRGSVGGAPPPGCTDDLDFGAVDIHGCLAEVSDPKDLPGGVTAELGEALCSSTGLILCLPSLVVGEAAAQSGRGSTASSEAGGVQALAAAGLPSYYSYSPVRLNGIDIVPQNGAPLLIVPAADAIASSSVELFLHGVQISPGAMPLTAFLPASGGLLANLTLANNIPIIGSLLPLTGAMSIDLYPAGSTLSDGDTCQYACAALHVNAALPDEFTDGGGNLLTAAGVIKADAINGVDLSSLEVDLPSAQFGGIGVSNVVFRYQAANDLIYAQATLDLSPAIGSISGTIEFVRGGFREASLDYDADGGSGIDLGGPIPFFLTHLGGSISLHPTIISARATIAGGPSYFGCPLMSISGQTSIYFAPFAFSLESQGQLFCQPVADMDLHYGDGYFNFGGEVQLSELWLPFQLTANVAVGVTSQHWQFDGDVNACLDLDGWTPACLGGEAVISDVGIGVCADVWGLVHAGGGIIWNPRHLVLYSDSCDIDRFRSIHHFVRGTFARSATPSATFTLPPRRKVELIGVVGEGGAPRVRLIGPGGRTIDTPADGYVKTPNDMVVADQKLTHTTYIFINHPAAGTWTVQPDPGSVMITAIRAAGSLPDPNVHAQLHPVSGARERLNYSLHPLAGQAVTFEEQVANGKRGYDVVGHAHGARGRITFSPSLKLARTRTLVAMVTQYGHFREHVVLAHFRAARPGSLPAPRGLHAHRSGTSVSLSWRPVRGASSYLVTVTAGKGVVRHALADRTAATLSGLPTRSPLVISVTARRRSTWANAPGLPATTHLAPIRPVLKRVKLVRST